MKIEGAAALVTGANRGLGAAIAQALLDSGATVYGGARDPGSITNDRLVPVRLDVTNDDDVAHAARTCTDVSISRRRRRGCSGRDGDELLRFDARRARL